jgi:hypothetical protein
LTAWTGVLEGYRYNEQGYGYAMHDKRGDNHV